MTDAEQTPTERLTQAMAALGLTINAVFVPWSKSRNAKTDGKLNDRSLNWTITLRRDGRDVLRTDYGAGIGHCPSYRANQRPTIDYIEAITFETEHGKQHRPLINAGVQGYSGKPILPNPADVMASLILDSDVIDHPTFESWASDLGYDTDSRKAEATYHACLQTALTLRNAVGEAGLAKLREAAQDY